MKITEPKNKSTVCSPDLRQWIPTTFDNFLTELDHVAQSCESADPATLYRGQTNYEWPLDSTFVRESIQHLFGLTQYETLSKQIRQSESFHRAITSLFLLKFGTLWKPSKEAIEAEESHGIDPWFELLKNLQQYPEKDSFINGTFLIDWSGRKEIALYFATHEGKGIERRISDNHGALWVCDAVATGKTLQVNKLSEIFKLMTSRACLKCKKTFPLIYHPQFQSHQPRATNQMPVYVSQMDFRYDIADIWASYEIKKKKKVFITLILTENLKRESARYLELNGITEEVVYPC